MSKGVNMSKQCVKCNQTKLLDSFYNNKNVCKMCIKVQAKARREAKMKEDMVAFKCYQMSASAHSRVFAKSKEHKKWYRNRTIK